jgi:hypothetical protein
MVSVTVTENVTLDGERPTIAARPPADVDGSCPKPNSRQEMIFSGKADEIVVDTFARDEAVVGEIRVMHGIKGVLEERVADLGVETGVDSLAAPNTPHSLAIVNDQELRVRRELHEGAGGNKAVPTCILSSV